MKENILNILKNSDGALDIYALQDKLNLKTVEETRELSDELRELEADVLIYNTNKGKYMLIENSHLRKGVLRANKKGFGFVVVDNLKEDVYISADDMNGAINDDVVLVEITSKMTIDKLEGRILKVVERVHVTFVGEYTFDGKKGHIKIDDKKVKLNIEIPVNKSLNAVDGHKVVVKLDKKLNNNTKYSGEIIEVIGHKNDPGVDILSIIHKHNISTEFPDLVKEEVKSLPNTVKEEEMVGRRDLRNEVIFTIDGDDTKDIDDAISIEKFANGNFKLGVHIADVSYYVKEGTELDNEAMERGTSVYLVDRVIPMIPHELSNGICSLNPQVDRLTMSCEMEFDSDGNQISYEIFPSVIKSRIQMTYKKVNDVIENNIVAEGYEPYVNKLKLMEELAKILRKMKVRRGYIDFEVEEAKIAVDENCVPTNVYVRERGTGEKLIEDFMIAANECVATHVYFMNLPFVYRVHETPNEEKIRNFLTFVGSLGYQMPAGDVKDISPKTVQKIINFLDDKEEFKILSSLLLRTMQKAVYLPENLGHYGLASKCYTHFTSPIRRYPDTTVHRLLRTYLVDKKVDMATVKKWEEKLAYITDNSSQRERASIECEREVEDMKMAEYMEQHIGEEFNGMISSVTSFGMFVELDNLIEGLIPIREMNDFFHYDEVKMTLTGERSGVKYTIGEKLVIKVLRASKEEKTIDFGIVKKL